MNVATGAPTRDFTPMFLRSAEVMAFPDMPQVFGKSNDDSREVYHVNFFDVNQHTVRRFYVKADKAKGIRSNDPWIPDHTKEARPDCTCTNFQSRCLDETGHWNGGVCKHVVARMAAILRDPLTPAPQRRPWAKLLIEVMPYVNMAALPNAGEFQALIQMYS